MDSRRNLIVSLLAATKSDLSRSESDLARDEDRISQWLEARRAENSYLRTRISQLEEDLVKLDQAGLPVLKDVIGEVSVNVKTPSATTVVADTAVGSSSPGPKYEIDEATKDGAVNPVTPDELGRKTVTRIRIVIHYLAERSEHPLSTSQLLAAFDEMGFKFPASDRKDSVNKAVKREPSLWTPGVSGVWLRKRPPPPKQSEAAKPKPRRSSSRAAVRAKPSIKDGQIRDSDRRR